MDGRRAEPKRSDAGETRPRRRQSLGEFLRGYLKNVRGVVKGQRGRSSSRGGAGAHHSSGSSRLLRETQTLRATSAKNAPFRLAASGARLHAARSKSAGPEEVLAGPEEVLAVPGGSFLRDLLSLQNTHHQEQFTAFDALGFEFSEPRKAQRRR